MPRYFFSVKDGQDFPDHERTIHASAEAACIAAVFASGEMIRAHCEKFWKEPDWQMPVTDEHGATVCDLRFRGTAGFN